MKGKSQDKRIGKKEKYLPLFETRDPSQNRTEESSFDYWNHRRNSILLLACTYD